MIPQVPQHLAPLRVIVPMQKHLPTWLLRTKPRCPRGPPQRKHIRNHPGRPNSPRSDFQRSFVGLFVGTQGQISGVILEYPSGERSHIPPGEKENHRLKSAFPRRVDGGYMVAGCWFSTTLTGQKSFKWKTVEATRRRRRHHFSAWGPFPSLC